MAVLNNKHKIDKNIKNILEQSIRDDLILTPMVDQFLSNWDGAMSRKAANRIARVMSATPRDRSGSWSASSAGLCWRRQELAFLGMPANGVPDAQLHTIFLNGTFVHLRWQTMLLTAGLLDNIEVTVKKPSQRARCTMDGAGTAFESRFKGREFGFELKGRNDWQYNKQTILGVDDKTRAQVDFEFLISGFDVFVIMNENKNTQAKKEWVFVRDDDRVKEMAKQIKELNKAIDTQKLHPMLQECKEQRKNSEWEKCPFGGREGPCINAGSWPMKTGI